MEAFRKTLAPARQLLSSQQFLGGNTTSYADYMLLGIFMWARSADDMPNECCGAAVPLAHKQQIPCWRCVINEEMSHHCTAIL